MAGWFDTIVGAAALVAQAQGPGGAGAQGAPPGPSGGVIFFFIAAFILLYWVIVLRPQRQEQKKRQEMLNEVSRGDHIVTVGGIHGTVEAIDVQKGVLSVSVAPKTTLRINKSAVAGVTPKDRKGKEKPEEKNS